MPLRVNNNITAISARRALSANSRTLSTRIERLATGLRINRSADDAAGLAVSEGLRAEIGGLTQAMRNAEQATNLTQVAEGALNEVSAMLIRMRELAAQSASSTINDNNRVGLTAEYNQLISEIDRLANVTSYNDTVLLVGFGNTVSATLSTSLSNAAVGVTSASISGAQSGTYTFIDSGSTDSQVTLGNGTVTQTINIATALDGNQVATGTTAIDFPFLVRREDLEFDTELAKETGRKDIVFFPSLQEQEIYLCLEAKRLNAVISGVRRSLADEYVKEGMQRFVDGKYARFVRHGAMLAYVLDGNIDRAIKNIENNIRNRLSELRMDKNGGLVASTIRPDDRRTKETCHRRAHEKPVFRIHHLFVAGESIGPT